MTIVRECGDDPRSHLLDRLSREHWQLLGMMDLLEEESRVMCRSGISDYSQMRNIVVYIQEYTEQVHHPLEDMICSCLLERAEDPGFVQALMSEHAQMEAVTLAIRESLEFLPECAASRKKLAEQLSEYLVSQRRHIYAEESELLPLAKNVLTERDWERLQYMLPILDDPIRGRRTWYDYQRLSREIEHKHQTWCAGGENGDMKPVGTGGAQPV